jgi:hypothetical protein
MSLPSEHEWYQYDPQDERFAGMKWVCRKCKGVHYSREKPRPDRRITATIFDKLMRCDEYVIWDIHNR